MLVDSCKQTVNIHNFNITQPFKQVDKSEQTFHLKHQVKITLMKENLKSIEMISQRTR